MKKLTYKYCYRNILLIKNLDLPAQWRWSVALFHDVKIKAGCGQLSISTLNGNWNYDTEKQALKTAKDILKSLGIRKVR